MCAEPHRINRLIESIADGTPVNWDAVDHTADAAQQRLLGHLRIVAGVADVHRAVPVQESSDATTGWSALGAADHALPRWGHLLLVAKVGEGAFGEVYRARDPWLDREVALKLLKPSVTGPVPTARLVEEARTLARVRHHNVVTVHGADMHDGRVGLWMELVRGRTLTQILAAQGPFSASEAALVGQEVCRALAAVHAAGLVHRDVKAQNVMRESGGRLVLMDFGAGGTPVYLAPELLAGGAPTVASDVYAVGVLLYHLVTADFPVYGTNVLELMRAHGRGERHHLAEKRPELPEAFVAAVERAVHTDPAQRFASMRLMQEALASLAAPAAVASPTTSHTQAPPSPVGLPASLLSRRRMLVAAGVALAVLGVAALTWLWPGSPREPVVSGGDVWVAVLPFRPIGPNPETIYYSDGLSDDLTAQLARLASVRVVSGTSTRNYRDTSQPPAEIGRQLKVAALVSGSVRLRDDRLQVMVEVVEAGTSEQLWADTFDRPLRDVLSVQHEIVQRVALALTGSFSPQDESRLMRRDIDYRAFDLYLKGRYFAHSRTPDGLRRGIDHFKQAIAIDGRSGLLFAGLADAFLLAGFYGIETTEPALVQAEANANRAVELDPDLAEAQVALGGVRLNQFRWSEAEACLTRGLVLNPSYAQAHHWYALGLAQRLRFDEALSRMREARALDPYSHALSAATAYVLLTARRFEEALQQYEDVLVVDPSNFQSLVGIIETHVARGAIADAQRALDRARRLTGRSDELRLTAAYMYALAGDASRSRRLVEEVIAGLSRSPASRAEIASVYAALGDPTEAFSWLESAVVNGDAFLGYLAIDPRYDRLRADPRFETLLTQLGLPSNERRSQ
jgi:eukaryotic-like serine/threonine-protein kinase